MIPRPDLLWQTRRWKRTTSRGSITCSLRWPWSSIIHSSATPRRSTGAAGAWKSYNRSATGIFSQITVDHRRYDKIAGPIVLATRLLYFGRIGRDADRFRIFGGGTDLIRGNTSGSYRRGECLNSSGTNTNGSQSSTGCAELDRLVGTQVGVATAEIRFPILTPAMHFVPQGFPPIEGAFYYDIGAVWMELGSEMEPRARGRSGECTHAAPGLRRRDSAERVWLCCGPDRLCHSAGSPRGEGALGPEPGPGVLRTGRGKTRSSFPSFTSPLPRFPASPLFSAGASPHHNSVARHPPALRGMQRQGRPRNG